MAPIKKIERNESLDDREKKRRIFVISGPILDDAVPRLAFQAAFLNDEKFDAVLVDEGQDFPPNWWEALRGIRKADGEMVLVASHPTRVDRELTSI